MQGDLEKIQAAAEKIRTINYRQYENPSIDTYLDEIQTAVAALKE